MPAPAIAHLPAMAVERLRVGVVADAHGIRGQVKIRSFTANPRDLTAYGLLTDRAGNRVFRVKVMGEAKNLLICAILGIRTRNEAEALRGTELYIDKAALPRPKANEFYCADLIGLTVHTAEGVVFGSVLGVHNFGAGDIVEIAMTDGHPEMFPLTRSIFPFIDIRGRSITINPPDTLVAWGEEKNPEKPPLQDF